MLWLANEDIEAARKLLAVFAQGEASGACNDRAVPRAAGRGPMLERARFAIALREGRVEVLGNEFEAEPPFDILLALYISEDSEKIITVTKMAELALLAVSTALRWLDRLVRDGWIERTSVAGDARKSRLSLTAKSRNALDQLFSWQE